MRSSPFKDPVIKIFCGTDSIFYLEAFYRTVLYSMLLEFLTKQLDLHCKVLRYSTVLMRTVQSAAGALSLMLLQN
jgi:hypothetical protein